MAAVRIVQKPLIIGISGGTASGKSSLSNKIYHTLMNNASCDGKIFIISVDSFYKSLDLIDKQRAKDGKYNFDHPDAFDFTELFHVLEQIRSQEGATIYDYDHQTFSRSTSKCRVIPPDVSLVVVEGILTFYQANIREIFHLKVFVDCDADTRLSRRVTRDTEQNKRDLNTVLSNYFQFVKPAFEEFCLPTKKYADIILPRGADNVVGIDLIIQHVEDVLHHGEPIETEDKRPSSDANFVNEGHHVWRTKQSSESNCLSTRPH